MHFILKQFLSDARHIQLSIQFLLLCVLFLFSDFAPSIAVILLTIGATLLTQFFCFRILKIPSTDYRSPLASSLSLVLLFKANLLWLYPLAGVMAMLSKFTLRWRGKHLFNPSAAAIVFGLLLFPDYVWVSPGQWGSAILFGLLLACLAALVLNKSKTADISLFFLAVWAVLLFGRALWLGDPFSIPMHNLQSGALLIFAFFMLSDPMTIPNTRVARFIFASGVAGVAFMLQYGFQIREALFYALFLVSFATPILDYLLKGHRYQWKVSEVKND